MRAGSRLRSPWPLVVLSALPVAGLALVARRVLVGQTQLFGPVESPLPFRERAGLLLNVAGAEATLVAPLLALGLVAWLARPASPHRPDPPALWVGAGVAAATAAVALGQCLLVAYLVVSDPPPDDQGFSFGQGSLLELFGPRAASALLLAVLGAALAAALLRAARRTAPAEVELLDDEPGRPQAEPDAALDHEPVAEQPVALPLDPHARFRRPS